jgi:hypothetical protein
MIAVDYSDAFERLSMRQDVLRGSSEKRMLCAAPAELDPGDRPEKIAGKSHEVSASGPLMEGPRGRHRRRREKD